MKKINVSNPWFLHIKDKKKTIEGRLNKGVFAELKKGEIIQMTNNNDSVLVKIKKITEYKSFREYLTQEGLRRTLPGIHTIDQGVAVYYKYYTPEQENEFRIIAIHIKVIKQ